VDRTEGVLAGMNETTYAIRDVIEASRDLTARMAKGSGMNANDLTAIAILGQHGPMGPVELARRLGISGPSATTLVDRLEQSGHLVRVRSETDRRRVTVTVTDKAVEVARSVWRPAIERLDQVSRSFTEDEHAFVRSFLTRIVAEMNASG